jgi:Tol biopolymer transport system component
MTAETPAKKERLESWKEIAAYLHRDVRTARRWEKDRGLPVRRFPGTRPGVYALVAELDDWRNKGASARPGVQVAATPARPKARRVRWTIVAAAPLVAAALMATFWATPARPRVVAHTEITHNGWVKRGLLRRGAALFYQSKDAASGMAEGIWCINGSGDRFLARLPPKTGINLVDVSADGSKALFQQYVAGRCDSELWEMPFANAQPRRLGNACATAAAWSPDGSRLAYVEGRRLYLARADGTAATSLLTLPYGHATDLRWSPDGRHMRLVLPEGQREPHHLRLWDIQVDSHRAAPLLPGWSRAGTDNEAAGQWTADGRFFFFAATHQGAEGIWSVGRNSSGFDGWFARPTLLANVAHARSVVPAPGANKVFAIVDVPRRGELLRLDPKTQEFALEPRWAWLSGGQLAFSPDGRRVAYLSYPEQVLRAADLDGKNARRLTPVAMRGAVPQWSPDGRRLAFMIWKVGSGEPTRIRITSPDGQDPIEPVPLVGWQGPAFWISDTELVFGDNGPIFPIPATCSLHVFDLKTGKVADLPHTTGLWSPRPCPAGRYIAAQTNDKTKLMLYDRRTAQLTELFHSPEGTLGDNPTWSRDGAYIYMDAPYAREPAIYRIRIAGGKVEQIASLAGIQRVVEDIGLWLGLAPDNSLLICRQVEGSEIESWDWTHP